VHGGRVHPGVAEIVHPVPVEEVASWSRTMFATFLGDPTGAAAAVRTEHLVREWEATRAWGARDRGRWVATLRTEERRLRMPGTAGPGAELVVDALTNVTVSATHRRRGLMSGMLNGSLAAARERGDAVSILIAAEWPIYGRFGYAPAIFTSDLTLRVNRRGAAVHGDVARVRQLELSEFVDVAPGVFEATRGWRWAGQLDRDVAWWRRALGGDDLPAIASPLPANCLVHECSDGPDGLDGLLAWRPVGDSGLRPPFAAAEVWVLGAAGPGAYRDLWAYLCGIDLVDEIRLRNRPIDEPVRWLLGDGRALLATDTVDFVWLRILDVPAALRARGYAVSGELVLEVSDADVGGFAAGRFRLSVSGETVACEPTREAVDVELTQRSLASALLGGVRLADRALAGEVVECRTGALVRADAMFATAAPPWNATWF
jgi:predicted acetyltransferase